MSQTETPFHDAANAMRELCKDYLVTELIKLDNGLTGIFLVPNAPDLTGYQRDAPASVRRGYSRLLSHPDDRLLDPNDDNTWNRVRRIYNVWITSYSTTNPRKVKLVYRNQQEEQDYTLDMEESMGNNLEDLSWLCDNVRAKLEQDDN